MSNKAIMFLKQEEGFSNSIYGLFKLKPASLLQKMVYSPVKFVQVISFSMFSGKVWKM